MKNSLMTLVLSLASAAFAGKTILSATDAAVSYTPALADAWLVFVAPGSFNDQKGAFLVKDPNQGKIIINPTEAFTGLEFWGWQRSDGGAYQITLDGGKASRIDVYNKKSDGQAHPIRLFTIDNLSNAKHVVQLTNLNDTRPGVGKFGQMNIDHIVLTTVDGASTNTTGNIAPSSSSATATSTTEGSTSITESSTTATSTTSESSAIDTVSTPTSTTGTPVIIQPPTSSPSSSATTPSSPQQNIPAGGAASTLGVSVSAVLAAVLLFAL
ncbi:hypothetical protein BKA62DRAFT_56675 [Auriculariales sp. MPI-PUGE-AT-0066]|nr:hypothetical protein BKA62DRAFT_56675 [Auriculariales sp. MPI-PUGE-AT-0066]